MKHFVVSSIAQMDISSSNRRRISPSLSHTLFFDSYRWDDDMTLIFFCRMVLDNNIILAFMPCCELSFAKFDGSILIIKTGMVMICK